jgi:hypothetical protein
VIALISFSSLGKFTSVWKADNARNRADWQISVLEWTFRRLHNLQNTHNPFEVELTMGTKGANTDVGTGLDIDAEAAAEGFLLSPETFEFDATADCCAPGTS